MRDSSQEGNRDEGWKTRTNQARRQSHLLLPRWRAHLFPLSRPSPLSSTSPLSYWEESESVSCSVVSDSLQPMDCCLPGSSVCGIHQARILGWVVISLLQEIFPIQEMNPGLLHCRWILYLTGGAESLCGKVGGRRKDEGCLLLRSLFGWPQPSQVKVTWEGPWIYRKAGRKKLESSIIFYMSLLSSCLFSFVNSSSGAALSHLYFIISAYRYLSLVTGWTVEPQGILRVIVGRERDLWWSLGD